MGNMDFKQFKAAVQRKFNTFKNEPLLFRSKLGGDKLWELYLDSFPEGTNLVYRERREYDCSACKQFIRNTGGILHLKQGVLTSIWDIQIDEPAYQTVADAMAKAVKKAGIQNVFLHFENTVGIDKNHQTVDDKVLTWDHFYVQLPSHLVCTGSRGETIGAKLGEYESTQQVFRRSLSEITMDAVNTVVELIDQDSLYRGQEHLRAVKEFSKLKRQYEGLSKNRERNNFCWERLSTLDGAIMKIRNTVIGSLLVDISEGVELTAAVASFEAKVAPTNYKRPKPVYTEKMKQQALQKIIDLGFESALERRYAVPEDIKVNNVLFANRDAKKKMIGNIFDEIPEQNGKAKKIEKVEEMSIDKFISDVLPKATALEVLFENKHAANMVSLIAPVDLTSKSMFKWPNNFSWSYTGDMTDSIKERVKAAGGRIEGVFCNRLSWFNYDDLDLHMKEPNGYEIFFQNRGRRSDCGGTLDVDMNAGCGDTRNAVENIVYENKRDLKEGIYKLFVNQFCQREMTDVGFEVEIELDGETYNFVYEQAVSNKKNIMVAEIKYSKRDGFSIVKSLPSSKSSKKIWELDTQNFHKVSMMLLSPNYWDDKVVGNKHYFFMLEGCRNEGRARGFFNEFLSSELDAHRKVLEMVGSKMKTEEEDNQLSGIGFSSTQRNEVCCRVTGAFTRVIKIKF